MHRLLTRAAASPDMMRLCEGIKSVEDEIGVFATPEYSHGIPGVLKMHSTGPLAPRRSVLMDKPVLVMSVSPAFTGGVRAQAQVHETLLAIPARIVTGPQTQAPSRIFSVTLPITSTSRLYASRYRPSTDLPRPVMYVELSRI
jgi:hypothetical protein